MECSREITELSIRDLFNHGKSNYVIPVYQRDYSWGKTEIEQLVQDIFDYSLNSPERTYYIGTLIVHKRDTHNEEIYEVIDGQQRLTTFFILLSYLKNRKLVIGLEFGQVIGFESRIKSINALADVYADKVNTNTKDYNQQIIASYNQIRGILDRQMKLNGVNEERLVVFFKYLLDNVTILRVQVPVDTDLNHYFEIMNNRGEQLEKTEILKAKMLNKLQDEPLASKIFREVWEACANMQSYIQYGFKPEFRSILFGKDWNSLAANTYEELENKFLSHSDFLTARQEPEILTSIIAMGPKIFGKNGVEESERFGSVINFSNFLLQVLKIQDPGEQVSLDDKRLLFFFEGRLSDAKFVKQFGFHMLWCKYLFDKYIIKREVTSNLDSWSLKYLQGYDGYVNTFGKRNQQYIMLLSMFHVSNPSLSYKYWLNAALNFLYHNYDPDIDISSAYLDFLEELAKDFLHMRYLSKKPIDFNEIIFGEVQKLSGIGEMILNQGTNVENFIFNYLDYKLWRGDQERYKDFEFTFRSSVEHFYPQNPIEGNDKLKEGLDDFGNLCLISNSVNSRLSNYMPKAKADHYAKNPSSESIKQSLMIEMLHKEQEWGNHQIQKHGEMMKKVLFEI